MDRKEFLSACACCGAALLVPQSAFGDQTSPGTPCNEKYDFAQRWAKRLIDILDREWDPAARVRLLESSGRACFEASSGPRRGKPQPGDLDRTIATLQKHLGQEAARRDGNTVYLSYLKSNFGPLSDGWCLCPLTEKGPTGLSGSYCNCSVGYVKEMFERVTDGPVKVELLESVKRGGKACRFKISLSAVEVRTA